MTFEEIKKKCLEDYKESAQKFEDWFFKPISQYGGNGIYDAIKKHDTTPISTGATQGS